MKIEKTLKHTIIISICSHVLAFGFFGFSFGGKLPDLSLYNVTFLGNIMKNYEMTSRYKLEDNDFLKDASKKNIFLPDIKNKIRTKDFDAFLKPSAHFSALSSRGEVKINSEVFTFPKRSKEPTITFYPILPSHFSLYFRDRNQAHIELEYAPQGDTLRNIFVVRRKISSGNLEVDLLAQRYIEQYLSAYHSQQNFTGWKTVKIDLEQNK